VSLERTTVHGAFCTSAVPGGASRARLPWQLRLRRRRAINAVGATPQLGLAAGLSARSTSSSVLGRQKSLCAKLEAEARAGERGALEVVVRNGELDGSAPSSTYSFVPAAPLPCDLQALTALKSTLLPDCRTQVSAPWRQFRPRVALEPTTGQLRLIGTVNLCRAGSPQPSYSRPDPCHSIDFTLPRFRFLLSLVARRRSARAYRQPRARPRCVGGAQDF
jgi:hypothetical protein